MMTISYEVAMIAIIGAVIIFGLTMFRLGMDVTEMKMKKQIKKDFNEMLSEMCEE